MASSERADAVTLMDVARHAGVSLATASRALNGSSRKVRDHLKERVLESARVLDYAPNAQAQAVARGRTNVVGLIVHDIGDPYFSTIASGVMQAAEPHDLLVTLASTNRARDRELQHVAALRRQRAQAVIVVGSCVRTTRRNGPMGNELAAFERAGGRVVLVSQPRYDVDTIVLENRAGAADLASALIELGYRRHAILAGPADLLTARDRADGYRQRIAKAGLSISPTQIVHGDFSRDGGYAAMASLLPAIAELDCVFAANDIMAVGAVAALREHGLSVPADISVAGFDDIATLRDVTPALTTVRLPLDDIGQQALQLALSPPAARPRISRVRGSVSLRESTPDRRP
jgi:LacI family transcriptional regulator, galactose operon repressor